VNINWNGRTLMLPGFAEMPIAVPSAQLA